MMSARQRENTLRRRLDGLLDSLAAKPPDSPASELASLVADAKTVHEALELSKARRNRISRKYLTVASLAILLVALGLETIPFRASDLNLQITSTAFSFTSLGLRLNPGLSVRRLSASGFAFHEVTGRLGTDSGRSVVMWPETAADSLVLLDITATSGRSVAFEADDNRLTISPVCDSTCTGLSARLAFQGGLKVAKGTQVSMTRSADPFPILAVPSANPAELALEIPDTSERVIARGILIGPFSTTTRDETAAASDIWKSRSAIVSGTLSFPGMDLPSVELAPGDILQLESETAELTSLTYKAGRLSIGLRARAKRIRLGSEAFSRDLTPRQADWLLAQHRTLAVWGATLSALTLTAALIRWIVSD